MEESVPSSQPPTPWKWLESTRKLQTDVYHYDFDEMSRAYYHNNHFGLQGLTGLTRFLDWNQTAAVQELAEIREEFSWKPWAKDVAFFNRDRIRDEVVDVLHFLGNILVAVGVTDEELEEAYRRKQQLNTARQASGTYSAQKGGLASGSDSD